MTNFQREILEELKEKANKFSGQILKSLQSIIKEMEKQDKYDRSLIEGLNGIMTHLENGGQAKVSTLPLTGNANELFKEMLKNYGVMFASITGVNNKNETIITRDRDSNLVENLKIKLTEMLGCMKGEMSPELLLNKYKDSTIKATTGLDQAEIEKFRMSVKKNIDYAVAEEPNDKTKYTLVYSDKNAKEIENTLDKTIFDFCGTDGHEEKKRIQRLIEERNSMIDIIMRNVKAKRTVILADSSNPQRFIQINNSGITLHNLKYDPNADEAVYDDKIVCEDYSKLGMFMDKLIKPVILSEQEFGLVDWYDSQGNARVDKDIYLDKLERCKFEFLRLPKQRTYNAGHEMFMSDNPLLQQLSVFSGLSEDGIDKLNIFIKENALSETIISDGVIACSEKDRPKVNQFMEKYVNSQYEPSEIASFTPIINYEHKFYSKNMEKLILSDIDEMPGHQFIIDNSNPDYMFDITPDGLRVYNKTGVFMDIKNRIEIGNEGEVVRDEGFDLNLMTILDKIENPILLNQSEVLDKTYEEINAAVYKHRIEKYECKAADELRELMLKSDSKEFDTIFTKEENLTDKQKEAREKIMAYKDNIKEVRTITDNRNNEKQVEKDFVEISRGVDIDIEL